MDFAERPRAPGRPWLASRWKTLALAALLVGAAGGVRLLLTPLWGGYQAYTAFYPAVMLAAYFGGRTGGAVAAGLSAAVGWWAFALPAFQVKFDAATLGHTLFFLANCSVGVVIISGLTETLRRLSAEKRAADETAWTHAQIFSDLNERFSHHLRMVSGLLDLQANAPERRELSEAMDRASAVSLYLARVHRSMAGRDDGAVEFVGFARTLVEMRRARLGGGAGRVEVRGERLNLSSEVATSLGVALLEACTALLGDGGEDADLTVALDRSGEGVIMRIAGPPSGAAAESAELLRAAVHQIGGRIHFRDNLRQAEIEISFGAGPSGEAAAARGLLH